MKDTPVRAKKSSAITTQAAVRNGPLSSGTPPASVGGKAADLRLAPPISKKRREKKNKTIAKAPDTSSKRGRPTKHGLSNTPTYRSWRNAQQRCTNPNHPQFKDYGGRGIKFRITIEELVQEIGARPANATLDRIDPDGHYEPGNVRWATRRQQARNKRNPGYYREKRVDEIRAAHKQWIDNTKHWKLSLKLINTGKLNVHEWAEMRRVAGGRDLPRASFPFDAPRDDQNLKAGWVELPSLVDRDQTVKFHCGPFGDMSKSPHSDAGIISGLVDLPSRKHEASEEMLMRSKVNAVIAREFAGLCYTNRMPGDKAYTFPSCPPERALMAVTAVLRRLHRHARMMPMAEVCEYLDPDDNDFAHWGPLRADWLIIPDFHVYGPKGYGIEPWLVSDLKTLLKWRISEPTSPTVIFATDHWQIDEEIGALIDRHFTFITPLEIQELDNTDSVNDSAANEQG